MGWPKARALARIFEALVKRTLRNADGDCTDFGTAAIEGAHRILEALALVPDQRVGGDADFVENDLAGIGGALSELAMHPVAGDARDSGRQYETRDALVLEALVGGRERDHPVGHGTVGDKMLGAIEHELVTVAAIGGAHRGDVGAGAGLGQREGAKAELLDQGRRDRRASVRHCRQSTMAANPGRWR